jgi:hypothetical protein
MFGEEEQRAAFNVPSSVKFTLLVEKPIEILWGIISFVSLPFIPFFPF